MRISKEAAEILEAIEDLNLSPLERFFVLPAMIELGLI